MPPSGLCIMSHMILLISLKAQMAVIQCPARRMEMPFLMQNQSIADTNAAQAAIHKTWLAVNMVILLFACCGGNAALAFPDLPSCQTEKRIHDPNRESFWWR